MWTAARTADSGRADRLTPPIPREIVLRGRAVTSLIDSRPSPAHRVGEDFDSIGLQARLRAAGFPFLVILILPRPHMQIPPIEQFREDNSYEYGHIWFVDPEGVNFTLMLPDGEPVEVDGWWESRPHGPSYELALRVLPELELLKDKAVAFLARIVNFDALALDGEPYVNGVHCNAAHDKVIVELGWTDEVYVRFSVTFSWRPHPEVVYTALPVRMTFWNA